MRWLCALVFAVAAASSTLAAAGLAVPPHLGALVLAALTMLIAALPRPTRRALERLEAIALPPPQWRPGAPLGPPRTYLRASL